MSKIFSPSFEEGFRRFVEKSRGQKTLSPSERACAGDEYHQMVQELYLETAKGHMEDYWRGVLNFAFLGGGERDILRRAFSSQQGDSFYAEALVETLTYHKIPSITLVPKEVKTPGFMKLFFELGEPDVARDWFDGEFFREEWMNGFCFLRFLELYEHRSLNPSPEGLESPFLAPALSWENVGLRPYLKKTLSQSLWSEPTLPTIIVRGL